MEEEIQAIWQNHTWTMVPCPSHKNIVGCRWVFKTKLLPNGSVECYKVHLAAKGYTQQAGLDFNETFSLVIKPATVRLILSLVATFGWSLQHLDVKNAFLHGILNKEVFMEQPLGYVDPRHPNHVCRLNKALYGLKQAPWAWFHRFSTFLLQFGFHCSCANPYLFVYQRKVSTLYLLIYVDDIVLTGSNPCLLKDFIACLSNEFAMKDLSDLHYFLGIEVHHTPQGLFLSQSKYALDILEQASMVDCKPVSTPMVVGQHLSGNGSPYADLTHFRSIVGALQYLTITCLDLAHSVNMVCQFMHASTEEHYQAVKRILRYIKGSLHFGLTIYFDSEQRLLAYLDANWAGCLDTRRSTSGFAVFLGRNLISLTNIYGDSSILPLLGKIFGNMPLFPNYIGACPCFDTRPPSYQVT